MSKEIKSVKIHGGHLRPTYFAIIQEDATRARMKMFDYMVNCAIYLNENNVEIPKDECTSDDSNRQTTIRKKVAEYIANRAEYDRIYQLRNRLYSELATKKVDYSDAFHATVIDGDVDELHYNLCDVEAAMSDYSSNGEGIRQDICNLISGSRTLPLEEAGDDTSFLLMCSEGTMSIPLKVRNGEIWIGALPSKSVIYLNGNKKVL